MYIDFVYISVRLNNRRVNVHYDLLRTGSIELTATKILERGFLDAVRGRDLALRG